VAPLRDEPPLPKDSPGPAGAENLPCTADEDGNIKDGNIKDGNVKDGNIKDGNIKDGNIKTGKSDKAGYKLHGVISHLGRHLSSGHSILADIYDEKQANWVSGALHFPEMFPA
jgi:hypothetical protein